MFILSDRSILINTFTSARKAREFFYCSHKTILCYTENGNYFKKSGFYQHQR